MIGIIAVLFIGLVLGTVLVHGVKADNGIQVTPSGGYGLLARDLFWFVESNDDCSPMWQGEAYKIEIPQGASRYLQVKIPTYLKTMGYEYHRYRWDLSIYVGAEGEDILLEDVIKLNKFWHSYEFCPNYWLEESQFSEKTITLPVNYRGKPLTVWIYYSFASHAKNDPGNCFLLDGIAGL